ETGPELRQQGRQALLDRTAPGGAEHVCQEEKLQLRAPVAAGRTSSVTWLPASCVCFASACRSTCEKSTTRPSFETPVVTGVPTDRVERSRARAGRVIADRGHPRLRDRQLETQRSLHCDHLRAGRPGREEPRRARGRADGEARGRRAEGAEQDDDERRHTADD